MHVYWDYTRHCNLSCAHCYNAPDRAKAPNDISTSIKLTLLRKIAADHPAATIHFLGGEPFVAKDIYNVAEFAKELGLRTEATTNGFLQNERHIASISSLFDKLHVSFDGATPSSNDHIRGVGVYDRVSSFLSKILDQNNIKIPQINLSATITQYSITEAKLFIDYCINHNVQELTISPIKLQGNALSAVDKLTITPAQYFDFVCCLAKRSLGENVKVRVTGGSKKFKEYIKWKYYNDIVEVDPACGSGIRQMRISSTGEILPCIAAYPSFVNSWISELSTNTRREIERGRKLASVFREASKKAAMECCVDCDYRKTGQCYSGCPVQGTYGPALMCMELKKRI